FDQDALGKVPPRFTAFSAGNGAPFHWEIRRDHQAPSPPNVLMQTGKGQPGENFAALLFDEAKMDHGEVSVRFKAIDGEENQGAGIIYRYQDPQNYYVIRADAREDTCAFYRIHKGKRKLIDSKEVIVAPYRWHELHITFVNGTYTALVDGEAILGGKDS